MACIAGCTSSDESLNASERYVLDTLYNAKLGFYKSEADSLCRLWNDSIFSASVDSILNERLDEIELLTGSRELLQYNRGKENDGKDDY